MPSVKDILPRKKCIFKIDQLICRTVFQNAKMYLKCSDKIGLVLMKLFLALNVFEIMEITGKRLYLSTRFFVFVANPSLKMGAYSSFVANSGRLRILNNHKYL